MKQNSNKFWVNSKVSLTDLDLGMEMIIFKSIKCTFEVSIIF
jgi:hypothetical protein